jgi:hypothetical protein
MVWSVGTPYDVEVFVSGYVVKHKAANALSRSQRTLLRLAKRSFVRPCFFFFLTDYLASIRLPAETANSL